MLVSTIRKIVTFCAINVSQLNPDLRSFNFIVILRHLFLSDEHGPDINFSSFLEAVAWQTVYGADKRRGKEISDQGYVIY